MREIFCFRKVYFYMNWKNKTTDLATQVLASRQGYPLVAKELAFQAAKFAARVRSSNPLSFILRPLFSHKHLRLRLGVLIALIAIPMCFWAPSLVPSFAAADTGGKTEITLIPAGEVNTETIQAVRVPIENFYISQKFWFLHPGIDMATAFGNPVHPVMAGTVKAVLHEYTDYGNHIIIDHGNGFESLYAHLSKTEVVEGQKVTTKTEIGLVGSTGHSTGPHLHLEIHQDGIPTDPAAILGIK